MRGLLVHSGYWLDNGAFVHRLWTTLIGCDVCAF